MFIRLLPKYSTHTHACMQMHRYHYSKQIASRIGAEQKPPITRDLGTNCSCAIDRNNRSRSADRRHNAQRQLRATGDHFRRIRDTPVEIDPPHARSSLA